MKRTVISGLIICIIFKVLVLFVVFIQQSALDTRAGVVLKQHIYRDQWGHNKGCVVVYDGYEYARRGAACPTRK